MNVVERLDELPGEWFVLDVMRREARSRQWTALLIDMDPEEFALGNGRPRAAWVHIPGKYPNRDVAWDALADMIATRH
jgi:hypothetical protein